MLLRAMYIVLVIHASTSLCSGGQGRDQAWRDQASIIQSLCLFLLFYHQKN